jgi:hypothetical protein
MRVRWHKFKAKPSKCYQGHYHPSKLEAGYCDTLAILKKNEEIAEYQYAPRFDMIVNGQKICTHIPDFLVTRKDGLQEVHECKGYEMPVWNLKRKLFEALYPNIEYIVIK